MSFSYCTTPIQLQSIQDQFLSQISTTARASQLYLTKKEVTREAVYIYIYMYAVAGYIMSDGYTWNCSNASDASNFHYMYNI